jgi:hypothetical protein
MLAKKYEYIEQHQMANKRGQPYQYTIVPKSIRNEGSIVAIHLKHYNSNEIRFLEIGSSQ